MQEESPTARVVRNALIRPAIESAKGRSGDLIENAVRINVENVVRQVRGSSPVLSGLVQRGTLTVVGAVYALDTGKVESLPQSQTSALALTNRPVTEACPAVRVTREERH